MNQVFKHSFFKRLLTSYFLTLVIPFIIALCLSIPIIYGNHLDGLHRETTSKVSSISSNIEQATISISKTATTLWNNLYSHSNKKNNQIDTKDNIVDNFLLYNNNSNIKNIFFTGESSNSKYFVSSSVLDDTILEYLKTTNKKDCWFPLELLNHSQNHNYNDYAYVRCNSGNWNDFIIMTVSKNILFDYTKNLFSDNNVSVMFHVSPISNFTNDTVINSTSLSKQNYNLLKSNRIGYFSNNFSYYYYQYIPNLNCTLIFHVDSSKYQPNLLPYILLFVAVLIGIGLLSIYTFLFTSNIKKRTMRMISALNNNNNNNDDNNYLSVRIPTDYSDDEIAYLNNQFQQFQIDLSKNINARIETELLQIHTQQSALQNQINPHFIYNTLEIFRMQAETANIKNISQAIAAFGAMLRYNMDIDRQIVSIDDEIKNIKNYISIMNSKYDDNIQLTCLIDELCLNLSIPKFTLQPIIENSIKNNSKLLFEHILQISVQISYNNGIICISISDDGNGIPEDKLKKINLDILSAITAIKTTSSGIGLPNIAKRFRFIYKENFYMNINSIENTITTVTLSFPEKPPT